LDYLLSNKLRVLLDCACLNARLNKRRITNRGGRPAKRRKKKEEKVSIFTPALDMALSNEKGGASLGEARFHRKEASSRGE